MTLTLNDRLPKNRGLLSNRETEFSKGNACENKQQKEEPHAEETHLSLKCSKRNTNMLLSRMKSALWLVSLLLPLTANDLPTQDKAPELFRASDKGLFHKAQRSKDGILVLNANNGFFDKGKVKAIGKKAGKPHEKDLISASFDELQFLPKKEDAKARWYLWSAEAGEIKIETDFGNHSPSPGEWSFQIDDHSAPLGEPISIQAGKQKVTLLRNGTPKEAANIKSLTLSGEPIPLAARRHSFKICREGLSETNDVDF
jgi:hypothetical protein